MFKKEENKINTNKVNEVLTLSQKILRVVYGLLILSIIALCIFLLNETKVLNILWGVIKIASPFFIGLIIAWLLDPFVAWLKNKKVNRTLGSIFAFFILVIVIVLVCVFLLPMLYEQINDFVSTIPTLVNSVSSFIDNVFSSISKNGIDLTSTKLKIFENLEGFALNLTTDLPKIVVSIMSSFFTGIGVFSLGLIVGFYLLIDFDGLKESFMFLPRKYYDVAIDLGKRLNGTFRSYIQGTLEISLFMVIITWIGFAIIGLKSPFLFAIIVGITNVIPYIGPWLGGAIASIVGFAISPLTGVLTILVAFIAQQVDSIVFQPLIMGKSMKLHPVTIVVGLLIFGYLFGVIGMVLAPPIIAGLKIILSYFDEKYNFTGKLNLKKNKEENELENNLVEEKK